jgi:hypothetical protein
MLVEVDQMVKRYGRKTAVDIVDGGVLTASGIIELN